MESVPANHISHLDLNADMNGKGGQARSSLWILQLLTIPVAVNVQSSLKQATPVLVSVFDSSGNEVAKQSGTSDSVFTFTVESPELWSPSTPVLHNITVTMGDDEISSYTGFRTISKGVVNGVQRHLLNGQFVFQFGTLDQGYWPDGLHLPPNLEAMVYDLKVLKSLGMNMVRKHVSCIKGRVVVCAEHG
jgi:beta-galactosidase/beta-glucuronidase